MPKTIQPILRISKLPDLTPMKMTISVDREIHRILEDYAQIYNENYKDEGKPAALAPAMVAGFLATDNGFKRARKALATKT